MTAHASGTEPCPTCGETETCRDENGNEVGWHQSRRLAQSEADSAAFQAWVSERRSA